MKIKFIQVHNFRGMFDCQFNFCDYSLLVGANNSGKTTLIDAIRAFYEKDKFAFKKENDFPFIPPSDQESWIEIEFLLTDQEYGSLAEDYKLPENRLKVRKYFQTAAKTHDNKSMSGSIFGYKTDGTLSNEPFYGAKNVQSGKFGDIIYIPAVSKVDEHTKLTGPSALRDLLTDIMSDVVEKSPAYEGLNVKVKEFSDLIKQEKTEDGRSLSGFEGELTKLLDEWQTTFKISINTPSANEIIKSMLNWDLIDSFHGKSQGIEYFGSGFQRHFIYSLIQVGSRYISKKETKKAKDFTPSLSLVLFEEPEAFLHPPQQEILARSLQEMASNESWQVICATHSSNFVSKNTSNIPAIIRLKRQNGKVEKYQIGQDDWQKIVDANQMINTIAKKYPNMAKRLSEDDLKPEMESVKQFLWLNPDRCTMFFACHVLLVEGPTEVALINRLISEKKIKKSDCGLYVLDSLGKYNMHRFMNLMKYMGIPHSVIHDDDNNTGEHKEINQLIEDSKDPFLTLAIWRVPNELESWLNIEKSTSEHRKPQHVLFLYDTGKIDNAKIAEFCSIIDSCLPK